MKTNPALQNRFSDVISDAERTGSLECTFANKIDALCKEKYFLESRNNDSFPQYVEGGVFYRSDSHF